MPKLKSTTIFENNFWPQWKTSKTCRKISVCWKFGDLTFNTGDTGYISHNWKQQYEQLHWDLWIQNDGDSIRNSYTHNCIITIYLRIWTNENNFEQMKIILITWYIALQKLSTFKIKSTFKSVLKKKYLQKVLKKYLQNE